MKNFHHWDHRVLLSKDKYGETYYQIHECHYAVDATIPHSWTLEPVAPASKTLEGLLRVLGRMTKAAKQPVLEEIPGKEKLREVRA